MSDRLSWPLREKCQVNVRAMDVEARLAKIEATLEALKKSVEELAAMLRTHAQELAESRPSRKTLYLIEERLSVVERDRIPAIERKLERLYAIGAVIVFILSAASAFLGYLLR